MCQSAFDADFCVKTMALRSNVEWTYDGGAVGAFVCTRE